MSLPTRKAFGQPPRRPSGRPHHAELGPAALGQGEGHAAAGLGARGQAGHGGSRWVGNRGPNAGLRRGGTAQRPWGRIQS